MSPVRLLSVSGFPNSRFFSSLILCLRLSRRANRLRSHRQHLAARNLLSHPPQPSLKSANLAHHPVMFLPRKRLPQQGRSAKPKSSCSVHRNRIIGHLVNQCLRDLHLQGLPLHLRHRSLVRIRLQMRQSLRQAAIPLQPRKPRLFRPNLLLQALTPIS